MLHTSRLASIDCYRGFSVLAMVLASYFFGTEALPAWLRRAPEDRLTSADFDTSCFSSCFEMKGVVIAS